MKGTPGGRQKNAGNTRDELIKAGVREINQYGVADFSMRRIAEACGISCGAPYKHFENRKEFIAAIIDYVNMKWYNEQQQVLRSTTSDTRAQIVEISVNYVKFLVENPHFRSILMLKDDKFDSIYHKMRSEMSGLTRGLVDRYCREVSMDDDTRMRKLYVVRSLIFGAAYMIDNGEMEYNEKTLDAVRYNIDREFTLP